jgi:neutral ceramidase
MFFTGCGADQNPLPRRSVELCRKYGHMLADGVEQALSAKARPLAPELRTALSEVPLDFERNSTQEEIDRYAQADGIRGRWARRLLVRQQAGEKFPTSVPYTVQVWRLGDQLWISLTGEVVVDYALRFKREFGENTWITSYAHDLLAYIPSRRVWEEGGYEGGSLYEYGLPAERWAGDVEDRIAGAVQELVARTK